MNNSHISPVNKLTYGIGSIAYGVKSNGFDYWFLIFYSQAMGVDAYLVGLALMISLVIDSLSDPLIGYFSDNTHTRWGRRHPFMYAAAIPVSLSYFFIWNPPASLTGNELFGYILFLAILVRTLITIYEIPNSAMVAEMTEDYDERTSILSYRFFFGWSGGTLMGACTSYYLLVPTSEYSHGIFNVAGYGQMGLVAALIIFTAIMTAAIVPII